MPRESFSRVVSVFFICISLSLGGGCSKDGDPGSAPQPPEGSNLAARLPLEEGWALRSSEGLLETGQAISTAGFTSKGWYTTSVPTTVLAALVENEVYPDPYFGMNLRSIPGSGYPQGLNFSWFPMPPNSPFRVSWWYRTEFELPSECRGRTIFLHFNGINYRANIWLNGTRLAGKDTVVGAYRRFRFEVTDAVLPGRVNCLAVEVFPPKVDDLAITWVDWNPAPPDKNMGIWHDVFLTTTGPVALRYPQVITRLDLPSLDKANLTVTAEVVNTLDDPAAGTLYGRIGDIQFSQALELVPRESRLITFSPGRFPQLNITNPRLWWPTELGPQNLYDLEMRFAVGSTTSDTASVRFGIREVSSELNEHGHRVFRINGRNILIKGAGWAPDMMLRWSLERQEAELGYVKDLHLNAIRLEGKLGTDAFLDLCDRYGILVMAGWCCCAHWEWWEDWDAEDYDVARESLKDQVLRLRNHPSVMDWLNGSDFHPPPEVERSYIEVLERYRWPNPYQSSATEEPSPVSGETGLKMTGPYEYVPPIYWYADTEMGGAFGFNTETGPGIAIPPVESLIRMLPEDHLWPIDWFWHFHGGGGLFLVTRTAIFTYALERRYGAATGLKDYVMKSQAMTYETQRAMFEAYRRNKYRSTGVIQWMLNDAWPSIIWHLYDYDLRPMGGYFGTKRACEPLHIQYSYDDRSVVVVNALYQDFPGMRATARVFNMDMTEKFSEESSLDVPADSSNKVFSLPEIEGLTSTYFLKLTLEDSTGKPASSNFYWLSTRPEILAWPLAMWFFTPTRIYADLTLLQSLPHVELNVSAAVEKQGSEGVIHLTVENPGPTLAFLVHLKVLKGPGGEELLPIRWEDNYFSLMPGEGREIAAVYRTQDLEGAEPVVEAGGWNVKTP